MQKVRAGEGGKHLLRLIAGEIGWAGAVSHANDLFETVVVCAVIEKIRHRNSGTITLRKLSIEPDQPVRFGEGQWMQDHRINHAEDGGVRADAEGQRECGDSGEARRLAQNAQPKAYVLTQRFEEVRSESFAPFFLVFLGATELDARAALGFRPRETGTLKIVSAMLDVGTQLLVHVVFNA